MLIDQYVKYLESFDMREFGSDLFSIAKDQGWLVVYGHSDDCIEFEGCFRDETYYDSNKFVLDKHGLIPSWSEIDHEDEKACEEYFKRKKSTPLLTLYVFDNKDYEDEKFMWVFDSTHQNHKFKIYDGDDPFCVGLVIDFKKLIGNYK